MSSLISKEHAIVAREVTRGAALFAVVIGVLVLVGWQLNIAILKTGLPGLPTMKANTAVGLILCGLALWLLRNSPAERQRIVARMLGGAVLLIATLTTAEYFFDIDLGIDQLLFIDPITAIRDFPGRPSAGTTVCLLMLGIALVALTLPRVSIYFSQLPAVVCGVFGFISLLSYAYGITTPGATFSTNNMAIHTAVAFMALGAALLLLTPDRGLMSTLADPGPGGMTARRLLPVAVLVPAALGLLIGRGQAMRLYATPFSLALFVVTSTVVFGATIWWSARAIARASAERRRVEEARQQASEQFNIVFDESLDVIIVVHGIDGHIIRANRAVRRVLGYEPGMLIGRPFSSLFPEPRDLTYEEMLQRVQAFDAVFVNQEFMRQDGSICHMDLTASVIRWGQEWAVILTLRDVSERRHLEEEVQRTERLRLELEKERDLLSLREEFMAAVSHDFRTPLTVIMNSTELLDKYAGRLSADKRAEQFERIRGQIHYMNNLLDDVLMLAHARSRQLVFDPTPVHLEPLCRALLDQVRLTSDTSRHYQLIADGDFAGVEVDEKLVQRILMNLLTNAVKYSSEGSTIRFEVRREGDQVTFRISDQGIGIPPEDQARLFQPFSRGSNTRGIKGTGLGLAIVYESVRAHQGAIEFTSEMGKGTVFTVRLPCARRTESPA